MKTITVSKRQLQKDYENYNSKQLCEKYGVCTNRLYKMLDECGIEHKRKKPAERHEIKIRYEE